MRRSSAQVELPHLGTQRSGKNLGSAPVLPLQTADGSVVGMPTFAQVKLPVPKSWDEFEDIVTSAIYAQQPSLSPQRHGRQGQSQHGVDIFFEDFTTRHTGVQCKC